MDTGRITKQVNGRKFETAMAIPVIATPAMKLHADFLLSLCGTILILLKKPVEDSKGPLNRHTEAGRWFAPAL